MQDLSKKTAIIFDQLDADPSFLLQDGDWTRFDGIYINSTDDDEDLQTELGQLIYAEETGEFLGNKVTKDEFVDAIRSGVPMIVCGFLT